MLSFDDILYDQYNDNNQENNGGERIDFRADLTACHRVDCNRERLGIRTAGKITNDEMTVIFEKYDLYDEIFLANLNNIW